MTTDNNMANGITKELHEDKNKLTKVENK